jgi:hypothetical protein
MDLAPYLANWHTYSVKAKYSALLPPRKQARHIFHLTRGLISTGFVAKSILNSRRRIKNDNLLSASREDAR